MKQFMLENAKAVIAFLTSFGTWGATAVAENGIDAGEWFGLCGVAVTTIGVWLATNAPSSDDLEMLSAWRDEGGTPPADG